MKESNLHEATAVYRVVRRTRSSFLIDAKKKTDVCQGKVDLVYSWCLCACAGISCKSLDLYRQ